MNGHVDLFFFKPEILRQAIAHAERSLRAGPYVEIVAIRMNYQAVRFEAAMRLYLGAVGCLDNFCGSLQLIFDWPSLTEGAPASRALSTSTVNAFGSYSTCTARIASSACCGVSAAMPRISSPAYL